MFVGKERLTLESP